MEFAFAQNNLKELIAKFQSAICVFQMENAFIIIKIKN